MMEPIQLVIVMLEVSSMLNKRNVSLALMDVYNAKIVTHVLLVVLILSLIVFQIFVHKLVAMERNMFENVMMAIT
jgi:hypothetical protein